MVEWNSDGTPSRMIGTHLDITERKATESELQLSRDRFASLVANIPGVIYRCKYDEKWTMLYMSDQIKDMTGYLPDDFINNKRISFADIIYHGDNDIEEQVKKSIANQQTWSVEYRIKAKDGRTHWVHEKAR
ncbi:PAS domain-containing protein (plasmid) [Pseudoalteromonas espejiana]